MAFVNYIGAQEEGGVNEKETHKASHITLLSSTEGHTS